MAEHRETVAYVRRSNGAWLVVIAGSATDDATPDDLYDCASSLRVAKSIARSDAENFGYVGPWRWNEAKSTLWELDATYLTTEAQEN